eukprot:492941-Prorocentrum_lima.AAC.1
MGGLFGAKNCFDRYNWRVQKVVSEGWPLECWRPCGLVMMAPELRNTTPVDRISTYANIMLGESR